MHNSCRHCGKETEPGELYCPVCSDAAGSGKPKKFWLFAISFSVLLLVLAGMMLAHADIDVRNFSWADLTGRPAAVINGETVSRAELRRRVAAGRRIIERQYGGDFFSGTAGRERLSSLRRDVLERVLEERLVAQEAERLGIRVSDEEAEKEIRRIGGEVYGSPEDMKKMLAEDGISLDNVRNHFRNNMTFQALAAAKAPGAVSEEKVQELFNGWLNQAKKAAQVTVYESYANEAAGPQQGGCCGLGGGPVSAGTAGCGGAGGCGGQKPAGPVDPVTEKKAKDAALAELNKTRGNVAGLQVHVGDYGCHVQVDIEENGQKIKSYSYRDGQVFEI